MLKYVILLVFLTQSIVGATQKDFFPPWSLHLGYSNNQAFNNESIEVIGSKNYSLGIDFFNQINFTRSYTTGFRYRAISFENIDYSLIFQCDLNTPDPLTNSWSENNHTFHYASIPIGLMQKSNTGENHFYLKAEFELLIQIKSTTNATIYECGHNIIQTSLSTGNLRNDMLLSNISLGYQQKLFKLKLRIEPSLSVTLNKYKNIAILQSDDGFYAFFYGLNIGLGI